MNRVTIFSFLSPPGDIGDSSVGAVVEPGGSTDGIGIEMQIDAIYSIT